MGAAGQERQPECGCRQRQTPVQGRVAHRSEVVRFERMRNRTAPYARRQNASLRIRSERPRPVIVRFPARHHPRRYPSDRADANRPGRPHGGPASLSTKTVVRLLPVRTTSGPAAPEQVKPRSASATSRDGAYRIPGRGLQPVAPPRKPVVINPGRTTARRTSSARREGTGSGRRTRGRG